MNASKTMGQGYPFFAVTFFVASGFLPAWLKNIHHVQIFQFSNAFILVAIALVKGYILLERSKYFKCLFIRHRKKNAAVLLLDTGKLMPQCILLNTGKLMPQCILINTGKLMP